MHIEGVDIKQILLQGNYVSEDDLKKAEDFSLTHHQTFLEYLISEKILTKELLGQAVAENFGINYINLAKNTPAKENVLQIPEEVAQRFHIVIAEKDADSVTIATDNPASPQLPELLNSLFPQTAIILAYAFTEDIHEAFIHYRQPLEARFVQILKNQKKIAPEILDQIFSEAFIYHASDIHFEPREEYVSTRFRVDGVLHEVGKIPKIYYENILNRIKVQAHLKTDEHFSAQDGSIRFTQAEVGIIDIRVSIVPTVNGEKVAMRLLTEYVKNLSLEDLGLSAKGYQAVMDAGRHPHGMVLVTGPTGSGKTTTLYALLKTFDHSEINITTIEDPVEYRIPTMNQIQVNAATNLNFADGLRSILRQDPDIILVGEVRDQITAEIAINAALTGHLLFTTFHANDAPNAIPRLLGMGIDPYLAASTLELIVAQRLVRKICENCRYSTNVSKQELTNTFPAVVKYFPGPEATLYRGKGCTACNHTGFRGRIGIFEFIKIDKNLRNLISKSPSGQEIWDLVRSQGFQTLFEDGLEKVKTGSTSLEELIRVASPTV